jgi:hypothetical protein
MSALLIDGHAFSSLLPTLTATVYSWQRGGAAGRQSGKVRPSLDTILRKGLLPTPTASDWKRGHRDTRNRKNGPTLPQALGGYTNPTWIEWFMGVPEGWTSLDAKHSATPSSPNAPK